MRLGRLLSLEGGQSEAESDEQEARGKVGRGPRSPLLPWSSPGVPMLAVKHREAQRHPSICVFAHEQLGPSRIHVHPQVHHSGLSGTHIPPFPGRDSGPQAPVPQNWTGARTGMTHLGQPPTAQTPGADRPAEPQQLVPSGPVSICALKQRGLGVDGQSASHAVTNDDLDEVILAHGFGGSARCGRLPSSPR